MHCALCLRIVYINDILEADVLPILPQPSRCLPTVKFALLLVLIHAIVTVVSVVHGIIRLHRSIGVYHVTRKGEGKEGIR